MPDLLKDIMSENSNAPKTGCGIAKLLKNMTKPDSTDLQEALENPIITSSAIDRALRKNGYTVSGNMVRRHRRKDCACGQTQ